MARAFNLAGLKERLRAESGERGSECMMGHGMHRSLSQPSICPLEDEKVGFLKVLMGRTLLMYHPCSKSQTIFRKCLRILRAAFFMGIVLYQVLYSIYFLVVYHGKKLESSLVYLSWLFQSFISMCFVIYWQKHGSLRKLVDAVPWKNVLMQSPSLRERKMCKTFIFYYAMLSVVIFIMVASLVKGIVSPHMAHLDPGLLDAYGHPRLWWISYVVSFYAFSVWNTVLTFYVIVTMVVQQELKNFNQSLSDLEDVKDREELSSELLQYYVKHVEIGNVIRQVDQTFEVYTFFMLGSNIPTTIFTLLAFFQALRGDWTDVVLGLPDLIFCVVEICGLTLHPAKIYSAVRNTEAVVYSNRNIWVPFHSKVYQVAQMFVNHCNQDTLGISLWGFAVVTKPLLLTTASLTLTYLTLLIEMNGPNEASFFNIFKNHTLLHHREL